MGYNEIKEIIKVFEQVVVPLENGQPVYIEDVEFKYLDGVWIEVNEE